MLKNPDFYPTPLSISTEMVHTAMNHPYIKERDRLFVLEPSAGKGDILKNIKNGYRSSTVHCIENDPELQATLMGLGYELIAYDFLTFNGSTKYDAIIMNPPFSAGAKHLLHAWEIIDDGVIVCLLNAETINNFTVSKNRELLKNIIDEHGTIKHMGKCFVDAERKTQVEVAMVTLVKKSTKKDFDFFEDANRSKEKSYKIDDMDQPNELAIKDTIGNLVLEFEEVKHLFAETFKTFKKILYHADHIVPSLNQFSKYLYDAVDSKEAQTAYNEFIDKLRKDCWENVFRMSKFEKYMTNKVKSDFAKFQNTQQALEFTKENIEQLFMSILSNAGNIQQACIEDVFDYFTRYWEENRVHIEGWVSNKCWMASRKVVLPGMIERWCNNKNHLRYQSQSPIRDIDIAMNAITGKNMESIITIHQALDESFENGCTGACESTHFDIRYYKKGTIHLKFKSEYTWKEFNIRACKMKGWLPNK